MARRRRADKRVINPDAKFGKIIFTKFINSLMYHGKRSTAETLMYSALEVIQTRTGQDPINVFDNAMESVMPAVEVRSRRVGGATYQVPVEVREERRKALAIRWLILAARNRKDKNMKDRLANEFLDASNNRGGAVKKREDTHKMAEANKAFSHYRW
jgi:small subunit ribosomal protein S7